MSLFSHWLRGVSEGGGISARLGVCCLDDHREDSESRGGLWDEVMQKGERERGALWDDVLFLNIWLPAFFFCCQAVEEQQEQI